MNNIAALDNLRKLAIDFRSDVYKRDEADYVLEIVDEIEREINERYIPKPDVPMNQKTKLTGINDVHEAARNLMGCATFVIGTGRNLTVDDFRAALGALVSIADMYYLKLPVDADGVPIHVGDTLEFGESFNQGIVKAVNECMVISLHMDCDYTNYAKYGLLWDAGSCRHVKPDPLKELLTEMLDRNSDGIGYREFGGDFESFVKSYAERIRELMGGDAS